MGIFKNIFDHLFGDNSESSAPAINPATGLPMMGSVDTDGNPYGTDLHHHNHNAISTDSIGVNPATGLPTINGIDSLGNPTGFDLQTQWQDHNCVNNDTFSHHSWDNGCSSIDHGTSFDNSSPFDSSSNSGSTFMD